MIIDRQRNSCSSWCVLSGAGLLFWRRPMDSFTSADSPFGLPIYHAQFL